MSPTTYTNIAKPSGTSYTNVNALGREQYNEVIDYDDSNVNYDAVNTSLYTNVAKPSATSYTNVAKP